MSKEVSPVQTFRVKTGLGQFNPGQIVARSEMPDHADIPWLVQTKAIEPCTVGGVALMANGEAPTVEQLMKDAEEYEERKLELEATINGEKEKTAEANRKAAELRDELKAVRDLNALEAEAAQKAFEGRFAAAVEKGNEENQRLRDLLVQRDAEIAKLKEVVAEHEAKAAAEPEAKPKRK